MQTFLSFYWPSRRGKPREDTFRVDESKGTIIVADGVTRTVIDEPYPDPSPARRAAEVFSDAVVEQLSQMTVGPNALRDACRMGNLAVRRLNVELGLWGAYDFWTQDLAGTVAAVCAIVGNTCAYAFLADCGVGEIAEGELLWCTPNRVPRMEQYLPPGVREGRERAVRIRRDFRNRPEASHPTYGVFTGEEEAIRYVEVGTRELKRGSALVVFSDGAEPFIRNDREFRAMLAHAEPAAIEQYVTDRCSSGTLPDEKTLVVVRFS